MGLFTKKGIMLPGRKITDRCKAVRIDNCGEVCLSMKQHIGEPCEPVVRVGEHVCVGQVVGDTDKFVSAPVHASVSGTISAIAEQRMVGGERVKFVTIKSDGEMTPFEGIAPPKADTAGEFLAAVRASGLVGLGGAGFPTHAKLKTPPGKVNLLIINAAECEPYITTDNREMIDNTLDVLDGIKTVCGHLGIKHAVIGIEDNKADAIRLLTDFASRESTPDLLIETRSLKSRYPQGAEKVIIRTVTGKTVPMGRFPADVGCLVMNITSIAFLERYMKTGKPFVSRTVTVDGPAVLKPMNVRVPVGIRINELVEFCGGYKTPPTKIILGGPMMGTASADLNAIISKTTSSVLLMGEKDGQVRPETACIRCGRCIAACPMNLMPGRLEQAYRAEDTAELERLCALNCMECGCCSYVCPASRQVVQRIRLGKMLLRRSI